MSDGGVRAAARGTGVLTADNWHNFPLEKELGFMNSEVGAPIPVPLREGERPRPQNEAADTAARVFALFVPLMLQMLWPLAVLIWLAGR